MVALAEDSMCVCVCVRNYVAVGRVPHSLLPVYKDVGAVWRVACGVWGACGRVCTGLFRCVLWALELSGHVSGAKRKPPRPARAALRFHFSRSHHHTYNLALTGRGWVARGGGRPSFPTIVLISLWRVESRRYEVRRLYCGKHLWALGPLESLSACRVVALRPAIGSTRQ